MKTVAALLGILTLFLLAGVVPSPGGMQAAVFRSPVFAALGGILTVLILVRAARNGRRPDFLLAHLGVAAILLGAFATYVRAVQCQMAVPVGDPQFTREARTDDGRSAVPLGFGLRVPEFRVEYFDPSYDWFEPEAGGTDLRFVRRVRPGKDGSLNVGSRKLTREDLREAGGRWREDLALAGGGMLCRAPLMPSDYRAGLEIATESGRQRAELRVNHPVTFGGWRFHLMSCDEGGRLVYLSARRDPGRWPVMAGIWATIAGVAAMCWRRSASKEVPRVA